MSFSDAPQVNQSVMPIHDDVDAELPAYLYTITSFVEMASQLRDGITFQQENDEAVADGIEEDQYVVQTRFIQFMLTGVHPDTGTQAQINLEPDASANHDGRFRLLQDFDSFYGVSETLPYQSPLTLMVQPDPMATLNTSNHMTRNIFVQQEQQVSCAILFPSL